MRKKYLCIGGIIALMAIIVILGISIGTLRKADAVLSQNEAEGILRNYLIESVQLDQWDEEAVLAQGSRSKIDDRDAYTFDLRFKESDRLISGYAITVDGNTIFWYDPANDMWIVQE